MRAPLRASLTAVAVVFVALTSLAAPVAAAAQVPFKGSFAGVETNTSFNFPFASQLTVTTGNATHLGRFTADNPHVVNVVTLTGCGPYEFTAANGDTVTAADVCGEASLTGTPGLLSIVEQGTITGGTGRFAGATGNFTVTRLFDSVAGTTTGSFSGTISSPGAGKH
jgi:hypothetical protein